MIESVNVQPTSEDRDLVSKLWEEEACPYFDLIMYGNGRVFKLNMNESKPVQQDCMAQKNWTRISEVPEIRVPEEMNEGFATLCSKELLDLGLSISVGECCASGENGFVAVTSISSEKLEWLAFFLGSNPFDEVEIDGGEIVVSSTASKKYRFPINNPERFTVEEKNSRQSVRRDKRPNDMNDSGYLFDYSSGNVDEDLADNDYIFKSNSGSIVLCDVYFNCILDAITKYTKKDDDEVWTGLLLPYHTDEGGWWDGPWEFDSNLFSAQLDLVPDKGLCYYNECLLDIRKKIMGFMKNATESKILLTLRD